MTLACVLLAGCAAHSTLAGDVVRAPRTAYRLGALDARWQRHDSDADAAFWDPGLDAMIMVNSECPPEHDAPLPVAANTLLLGFTGRQTLVDEPVTLDGRQGLHRRVRAKLDGAPLVLDLVVLKKDGCLYDLVYLAPPDSAARGRPAFARLVAGFATVGGERLGRGVEARR